MKLEHVLKLAVKGEASDIILKVGAPPRFRYRGRLVPLTDGVPISPEMMKEWLGILMPARLSPEFERDGDADFRYTAPFQAQFRVNAFRQRGQIGMVLRVIKGRILTIADLGLPPVVESAATLKRGLVLVTGATGSGKSTTLAAIVQAINLQRAAHIVTIEDPIEYFYEDHYATIEQREIGDDTTSFSKALRASLRQNPDVILVGELRDAEATETALMAAETGHLVLSTLHTQDAVDSLTRLMSYFSPHQHRNIRLQLAATLNMVVSQRLVPRADGKGLVPAVEVLMANSLVKEVILSADNFDMLPDAIQKGGKSYGMQSFDQSLHDLCQQGVITEEQAVQEASSRENMKLLLSGVS